MNNLITCPHCHKSFSTEDTIGPKAQAEIDRLIQSELILRKQKTDLEDRQRQFDLEKQRAIDAAAKDIWTKAEIATREQMSLQVKERELTIDSLKKSLEDAQRKASQGSQQIQGEVAELELEKTLRDNFPADDISEIKKGSLGADIRQIVRTNRGNLCGVILWESKRTKSWSSDWTIKLKEDLRAEKANIPVIVSSTLPKDLSAGFGLIDGVWVTSPHLALPLALILRQNLTDIARERVSAQNRGEKADLVYEYVTSHEFRDRLQAIIEVYQDMETQIGREKTAFEKIWRERQSQVQKLLTHTASLTGSLQGLSGSSFPALPALEL